MVRGKPVIDAEKCKGCELCPGVCPEKILEMGKDFNSMGVPYPHCTDEEKCTTCMQCALICPDMAITIWRSENR